eukprot:13831507-Alexandrium_andersonii.AAC.1
MSASLVGSEMCIRDSAWTLTWIFTWIPARRLSKKNKGAKPKVPMGGGLGCLLYTSDAADDM